MRALDELLQVVLENKIIREAAEFHPRAMKLMLNRKPFVVVAEDEPYYADVYLLIRLNEKIKGTWTEEDESIYQTALGRSEVSDES